MNIRAKHFFTALAIACAAAACSQPAEPPPPPPPAPVAPPAPVPPAPPPPPAAPSVTASAELAPTQGNAAAGTLTLTLDADGVRITGSLTGVGPGGTHGFHVHETGDCSAPDASSAGPHFNPGNHPHGHPGQGEHHAGDMPAEVKRRRISSIGSTSSIGTGPVGAGIMSSRLRSECGRFVSTASTYFW